MGIGSFSYDDWEDFARKRVTGKSTKEVFSKNKMIDEFNPLNISLRESRDSKDNPNSNAIIVALDVTGSMDPVLDSMARKGLPTLAGEIIDRKPVLDPHIMFMGIGDAHYDSAPLQVTQFEADIRIAEQMKEIYLEGGGGGNNSESYHLAWYFAAMKTSIDCFEKRNNKGYLFTVGDEFVPPPLTVNQIRKVFGDEVQSDISSEDLFELASRTYNVFHIIIEEGWNASRDIDATRKSWRKTIGQRTVSLSDHTKLSEVIVSIIQAHEGEKVDNIIKSWDGTTSMVVNSALSNIKSNKTSKTEVVEL